MRGFLLAAAFAASLVVASVALAASRGAAHKEVAFPTAAERTAAAPSFRFELTSQIIQPGEGQPYTLHAQGATRGRVEHLHLKVDDMTALDGSTMAGPSADVKLDGTFLYVRSTVTRNVVGPLWVRERLAGLAPTAPELKELRQVSPAAILAALRSAVDVQPGADAGVFHAKLLYANPFVRTALDGLEGGTEFRDLRLTAWSNPDGMLRLVLITGKTADRSARFLLTVALGGYDKPVAVTPPPQGNFVDFALSSLAA